MSNPTREHRGDPTPPHPGPSDPFFLAQGPMSGFRDTDSRKIGHAGRPSTGEDEAEGLPGVSGEPRRQNKNLDAPLHPQHEKSVTHVR